MKHINLKLLIAIFFLLNFLPVHSQTILGIDISHHQNSVDWAQVKASGKVFCYAKATEGRTFDDPNFTTYMKEGSSAGVVMGAYHFARPDNNTAEAEANHFLTIAKDYLGRNFLAPVLDLEVNKNISWTALATWAEEWLQIVENATGVKPVVYVNKTYAENLSGAIKNYPLWLADYNGGTAAPPNLYGWKDWLFKQYTASGTVSGISGNVDLDVYNGTAAEFDSLVNGAQPYRIIAKANPSDEGTISGGGAYNREETATVSATAKTGYVFVHWTEGGTEVSTNANYSFTVTEDRTLVAEFSKVTSISDLGQAGATTVYPNPNNGQFTIKFNNNYIGLNIKIYSVTGAVIKELKINKSIKNYSYHIDLNGVAAAGTYYIDLSTSNKKITKTIIIN